MLRVSKFGGYRVSSCKTFLYQIKFNEGFAYQDIAWKDEPWFSLREKEGLVQGWIKGFQTCQFPERILRSPSPGVGGMDPYLDFQSASNIKNWFWQSVVSQLQNVFMNKLLNFHGDIIGLTGSVFGSVIMLGNVFLFGFSSFDCVN